MKKRKIIVIIIFLIGISLLLYPRIGNIITSIKQKSSIDSYKKTVSVIDKQKIQELYNEAVKYNEKIYSYRQIKKRYNFENEYKNVLDLDNNIMGYIEIPKVRIKLPIYHDVEDSVLQLGVGHLKESSLPIGTTNQNSLLMGHSGLPAAKIFSNLEKIKINDYITITILNKKYYYKVINTEVVEPDDVYDKMKIEEGKSLITLVTCTPYGVNSHRLVITSEKTDSIPKSYTSSIKQETHYNNEIFIISIIAVMVVIISIYLHKKKKVIIDKNNTMKDKVVEDTTTHENNTNIINNKSINNKKKNNKKKKKKRKMKQKGNNKNGKKKKKKH